MIFTLMAQPPKRTFDDILPGNSSARVPPDKEGKTAGAELPGNTSGGPSQSQSQSQAPSAPSQSQSQSPGDSTPPHTQAGPPHTQAGPPHMTPSQGDSTPPHMRPSQAASASEITSETFAYPESSHNYLGSPASGKRMKTLGPLPWLGFKQLFIPVLFIALIGIAVGVLTSVGHKTPKNPVVYVQQVPIIFVFHTTQGTISPSASSQYTITMQGVPLTSLSYGGSSALSLLQANVLPTPAVIANWKSYRFRTSPQPPNGALVMSTPSSSTNSVAITVDNIAYDQATQVLTIVGPLIGAGSNVTNLPTGFGNANFYVDSSNGLTIDGCQIEPGTQCAGAGGPNGQGDTTFINQNLAYAELAGSNFSAANLTDANLANANLNNAKLGNAILTGANMTNINLSGANLASANLNNAILADATLFVGEANNALFRGANLTGANLSAANFAGADFTGADLSGTIGDSTNFVNANFTNANLTNANLSSSDLNGANLTNANLTNANLSQSGTQNLILNGAFLCNTTMPDGSLQNPGC